MNVLILRGYTWEALYINGDLINEGRELGNGLNRLYLLETAEKYGFTSKDVKIKPLNDEDNEDLYENGKLPLTLDGFKGKY